MDVFNLKKFRKAQKANAEKEALGKLGLGAEEFKKNVAEEFKKDGTADDMNKLFKGDVNATASPEMDDEDDDFITNEVKRRLKELRRNSFMVLIPEETGDEGGEEEEGETSSSEWRDLDGEILQSFWCDYNAVHNKYCELMLLFDRMSAQQLNEIGLQNPSTPSPRSASKKLASTLRSLSLKKVEEPEEDRVHLQQPENEPYQDLETAYVAQMCLTWEALHCQYSQLCQNISRQPENRTCYNHAAQQFQQFQVLLQRFIENEPFELGVRAEIYARSRRILPKLLQVPNVQGSDAYADEDSEFLVLAPDLVRIIQSLILTFYQFVKTDKKKSGVLNLFRGHNQMVTPLQQVQSVLDKKKIKLKELRKKKKAWKTKSWPGTQEDVELLFGLIDVKLLSRVLRIVRITKEQILWCEYKMKKLDLSDGKLRRGPSPILFPS